MKHNLKKFPHFVSGKYGRLLQEKGKIEAFRLYSLEVERWEWKFEQELRQLRMQSNFVKIDAILGEGDS